MQSPNYLYPSRGRKHDSEVGYGEESKGPNYLYPSRGRKPSSIASSLACCESRSELPLPLTGTETAPHSSIPQFYEVSELPLPLTGTETTNNFAMIVLQLIESELPLPLTGTETVSLGKFWEIVV